ncbi:MAG: hypothetical protein ACP5XB_11840 [Isosphaeraceae bacterium]
MYDSSWDNSDEFNDRMGENLLGRFKAMLGPTEYLLWADRPILPRPIRIPFVPALFVSVVAGLSGFCLAAMFGLVGQDWMDHRLMILALGLSPAVLGTMIFAHLISLGVRRWLKRRRLARLVYAVTDHRAIVARIEASRGIVEAFSLHPGEIADTRSFENPDGSGDLYFLGAESDDWLPFDFLEVPRVSLVESLVREALIDVEQDWWKRGTAGAY